MKLFSLKSMMLGLTMVVLASASPVFAKHKHNRRGHCKHGNRHVEVVVEKSCDTCPCEPCCREFVFIEGTCCPSPKIVDEKEEPGVISFLEALEDENFILDYLGGAFTGNGGPIDITLPPYSSFIAAIEADIVNKIDLAIATLSGISSDENNLALRIAETQYLIEGFGTYIKAVASGASVAAQQAAAAAFQNVYASAKIEALRKYFSPECFTEFRIAEKVRTETSALITEVLAVFGIEGDFDLAVASKNNALSLEESIDEGIYHEWYKRLCGHRCHSCDSFKR